jgi:quercetin dioxygenase-like cupin family protein
MMTSSYKYISELSAEVQPPSKGILSRAVFDDGNVKVVMFGFGAGDELSEHTASTAAIVHVLDGEATITLGVDSFEARSGTWIHMPPALPHSIRAKTPTLMLLTLLKNSKS